MAHLNKFIHTEWKASSSTTIEKYYQQFSIELITTCHRILMVNGSIRKRTHPLSCADPESFVRGGPTLTTFFGLFFS